MLHRHPFPPFFDSQTTGLILGTFPGKRFTAPGCALADDDWYYSSRGNQLWPLLYHAFDQSLPRDVTRADKQALLQRYRLGMTDIVEQAYRIRATNQDQNLQVQAIRCLDGLLERAPLVQRIYLTSKSMYREFFLPAYFPDKHRQPQRCDVLDTQTECYRYCHVDGRQIHLVLLPSPARQVKGVDSMRTLYRQVFSPLGAVDD